jgi:hypothetical protein
MLIYRADAVLPLPEVFTSLTQGSITTTIIFSRRMIEHSKFKSDAMKNQLALCMDRSLV